MKHPSTRIYSSSFLGLLSLFFFCIYVNAVDKSKFRTCDQTAFCKRHRNTHIVQEYFIEPSSVTFHEKESLVTCDLKNGKWPLQPSLSLNIQAIANAVTRVSVREHKETAKGERYEVQDVLEKDALTPLAAKTVKFTQSKEHLSLSYVSEGEEEEKQEYETLVTLSPFSVTLKLNGESVLVVNGDQKMNFEILREKNPKPEENGGEGEGGAVGEQVYPYDEEGMWGENFKEHKDDMPRGPQSIGIDVSFLGAAAVYGIPEHATSFALKNTDGTNGGYNEPYRLFNLDVFEYDLDVPMALYGAVPFMVSHNPNAEAYASNPNGPNSRPVSASVFYLNAAETFIDVSDISETSTFGFSTKNKGKRSHWYSEAGVIDLFLTASIHPKDISFAYNSLTGMPAMPQEFSIAYHQCRWNYKSETDVREVDAGFDAHDIPYDVLWLDIEHTDGKRYFTWDKSEFPTPKDMQQNLANKGRRMVTIVDPHIKKDNNYYVYSEAIAKELTVLDKNKSPYDGWCWPGSSTYLDFLDASVRDYWSSLFGFEKYQGSTPSLYTWNDMNEPSVFNGPEVTMQKESLHLKGTVEHREVHNLYGFYHQMATAQGQLERHEAKNDRPFVLTRSVFAGSQKYGAMWTGDNMAKWDHLEAATPMLLSLGIAGITFSGADVGGFFGNPEPELLVRWYQAAAYQPFFRGHAHIDTNRREPWLFGEPYTSQIKSAIRRRYSLLPYIYTLYFEAHVTGVPVMRPLWMEFPEDESVVTIDHEFMLGGALLVCPVDQPSTNQIKAHLPGRRQQGDTVWMNVVNGDVHSGRSQINTAAPADRIPVFQKGGTIVPKRERARRSSAAMRYDPYTLVIAPDQTMSANGTLFIDDGRTFDYESGSYIYRRFSLSPLGEIKSESLHAHGSEGNGKYTSAAQVTVERIVILGFPSSNVGVSGAKVLDGEGKVLRTLVVNTIGHRTIIKKPDVFIEKDWTIKLILHKSA